MKMLHRTLLPRTLSIKTTGRYSSAIKISSSHAGRRQWIFRTNQATANLVGSATFRQTLSALSNILRPRIANREMPHRLLPKENGISLPRSKWRLIRPRSIMSNSETRLHTWQLLCSILHTLGNTSTHSGPIRSHGLQEAREQ